MSSLDGAQIEELSRILVDAVDESFLERATHVSTGDRLYDEYVRRDLPMRPTIEALLNALERQGTTEAFLHYVYVNRPHKKQVRDAIERVLPSAVLHAGASSAGLSVQVAGSPQENGSKHAAAPGFERNLRPRLEMVDYRIWLQHLSEIERQVCRIEYDGKAAGTGFLVGPQAVLTNWHVVEGARSDGKLGMIACRFDYQRLANGARDKGTAVALDRDALLDHSPYSPAEAENKHVPPPTLEELDYALLRLETPVGTQPGNDGQLRGWIVLRDDVRRPDVDDPLLIVQHPDGTPMKLALDTQAVIQSPEAQTRIRYMTNTETGSSGSPCFSLSWELLAVHHYGDPAWEGKKSEFNQGIPISVIRKLLDSRGLSAELGS